MDSTEKKIVKYFLWFVVISTSIFALCVCALFFSKFLPRDPVGAISEILPTSEPTPTPLPPTVTPDFEMKEVETSETSIPEPPIVEVPKTEEEFRAYLASKYSTINGQTLEIEEITIIDTEGPKAFLVVEISSDSARNILAEQIDSVVSEYGTNLLNDTVAYFGNKEIEIQVSDNYDAYNQPAFCVDDTEWCLFNELLFFVSIDYISANYVDGNQEVNVWTQQIKSNATYGETNDLSVPASSPTPDLYRFDIIDVNGFGDTVVNIDKPNVPAVILIGGNAEEDHFAVINYDAAGNRLDLLVNTGDPYVGMRPLDFRADEHTTRLEILASGEWMITIAPLFSADTLSVPGFHSGEGDDVLILTGDTPDIAEINGNPGSNSFSVSSYGPSGSDLLVNTGDPYYGQVIVPRDTLALEINAVGTWNISVSSSN